MNATPAAHSSRWPASQCALRHASPQYLGPPQPSQRSSGLSSGRWPQLSQKRRVAIHVPSLSFDEAQRAQGSMGHFATRQNLQMSRLCSVADPLVDVVYVCPFALSDDLSGYYHRLLELSLIHI